MHRDDPQRLSDARFSDRVIGAPRGTQRTAKSWLTEAPLRMLMNNLDPEVAERPHELSSMAASGAPRATGRASTRSSRRSPCSRTTNRC